MRKAVTAFAAAGCLLLLGAVTGDAKLWERDFENIRVAFMAGYFRALQLDEETIGRRIEYWNRRRKKK